MLYAPGLNPQLLCSCRPVKPREIRETPLVLEIQQTITVLYCWTWFYYRDVSHWLLLIACSDFAHLGKDLRSAVLVLLRCLPGASTAQAEQTKVGDGREKWEMVCGRSRSCKLRNPCDLFDPP